MEKLSNKVRQLIVIVAFMSVVGCNMSRNSEGCGSDSISILKFTIDLGLRKTIINNVEPVDSMFINDLIGLLDEFNPLLDDYVLMAGGFDPNTWILSDGCKIDNRAKMRFENSKVFRLTSQLEELKLKYTSKDQIEIIDSFISVSKNDLGTNGQLYTSIENASLADIIMSLLVIQNKLYVYVIEKYQCG